MHVVVSVLVWRIFALGEIMRFWLVLLISTEFVLSTISISMLDLLWLTKTNSICKSHVGSRAHTELRLGGPIQNTVIPHRKSYACAACQLGFCSVCYSTGFDTETIYNKFARKIVCFIVEFECVFLFGTRAFPPNPNRLYALSLLRCCCCLVRWRVSVSITLWTVQPVSYTIYYYHSSHCMVLCFDIQYNHFSNIHKEFFVSRAYSIRRIFCKFHSN